MAAGDVTVLGPYTPDTAGMAAMDTALTAAQSGAANDKTMIVPAANGLQFWVVWIEGA